MRILFATTAGARHFGPLVPFARAAVASGHAIAVAAPRAFEARVREAGFDFEPLGEASDADRQAMFGRLREATFDDANRIMLRDGFAGIYARAGLPALIDLIDRWRPEAIVRESLELASLAAAERASIPHASVAIGLRSLDRLIQRNAAEPIAALFEEAGVVADRVVAALEEPQLTLTPPSLEESEYRRVGWAFRSETSTGPGPDLGRSLVFITLGSEAAAQGLYPDFYRALIGTLAANGPELLIALGSGADPAALGSLPPDVRVERWVDQPNVLQHAQATVFHGGYGTMIDSLAAGVPLIGMPLFSIDQRANTARIAEVGAGLAIDGPDDLKALPNALHRVLNGDSFRTRAREFATEIASLPTPIEAIARLEGLMGSSARP